MNELVRTNNPFSSAPVAAAPSNNAIAQSDQQRAIAEVQSALIIARANPRDPIAAMDKILNACTRPTLADSAVYTYSRGGSDVTGPSIRLAEAMAQSWGNMQFGIRELDQRNGESTVQAFAWDVETNTKREITFQVPHMRYTRNGSKRLEDPRDIYEMIANQGARRLRACILAVIPGDVTEAAVAQCETTMKAKADTSPEGIQKMVAAFEPFGVGKEQIEARIQRRLDAIQPAQVVSLKKIYASLRDGMSVASEWFDFIDVPEQQAAQTKTASVKETLRQHQAKQSTREEKPQAHDGDDSLFDGAINQPAQQNSGAPEVTFDQVKQQLERSTDQDVLDVAADLIQYISDFDQQQALNKIYKAKADSFKIPE